MSKKKTLQEIRAEFKKNDFISEIRKEIDELQDSIKSKPFNPEETSLNKLHEIMDEIQVIQTKLAILKKKALRQETICKLYDYDVKLAYGEKYDTYLNDAAKTKVDGEKTLKANMEANARKKLRDDGIEAYKIESEKKEIRIKGYIKEIDTFMLALEEIDNKCSRKISLMQLQNELGVLVDVKSKQK